MRHAESVTFGGSALDRAAHIRADADALAAVRADPQAGAVVLWHGKPLVQGEALDRLARVPLAHPVLNSGLARHVAEPVFLGFEDDRPLFACDISGWEPEDQDTATVGAFVDLSLQRHPAFGPDIAPEASFAELRRIMTRLSARDAELAASARAVVAWHDTHPFCARCGGESIAVQGGWQRHCPSCGASHFPRTDPVVIMLITLGNSVLMGRSPGWPEGMYSLLAGFVEPGETIEAAVRREVAEEASVPVGEVTYLASQPWPFPASLMIGCAGTALAHDIKVDPAELEDAIWVTREEMMDAFAGRHPWIKPARKGAIAHFLLENWLADRLD